MVVRTKPLAERRTGESCSGKTAARGETERRRRRVRYVPVATRRADFRRSRSVVGIGRVLHRHYKRLQDAVVASQRFAFELVGKRYLSDGQFQIVARRIPNRREVEFRDAVLARA